jgi:hypothetical protein
MFSRITSFFEREEKKPNVSKPDIKDLLVQIKNLTSEEKELIRTVLDEPTPTIIPTTIVSSPKTIVSSPSAMTETEKKETGIDTAGASGAVYEYAADTYKKRTD